MSKHYRDVEDSPTAEYLHAILNYYQDTGIFIWKVREDRSVQWNGHYAGSIAGTLDKEGRRRIKINRVYYLAARLAWLYTYGQWPKEEIDHIDLNPQTGHSAVSGDRGCRVGVASELGSGHMVLVLSVAGVLAALCLFRWARTLLMLVLVLAIAAYVLSAQDHASAPDPEPVIPHHQPVHTGGAAFG